jgi:hypothetical protein
VLPASLTHLTFGHWFNQPLAPGVLPASLTHLTFGHWFNQPLHSGVPEGRGVLPASLTHLTLGEDFKQKIDHLPRSIIIMLNGKRYYVSSIVPQWKKIKRETLQE